MRVLGRSVLLAFAALHLAFALFLGPTNDGEGGLDLASAPSPRTILQCTPSEIGSPRPLLLLPTLGPLLHRSHDLLSGRAALHDGLSPARSLFDMRRATRVARPQRHLPRMRAGDPPAA